MTCGQAAKFAGTRFALRLGMAALRVISVTSGKGGVGKSHVALNVATYAAQQGHRTVLIDGNAGLSSLDVLVGVRPTKHLGHLLEGASLAEVLVEVPGGVWLLPAASGERRLAQLTEVDRRSLNAAWSALAAQFDVVVVDAAPGVQDDVVFFSALAHHVVLVCNGEPTSLADAVVLARVLREHAAVPALNVVVNPARTHRAAAAVFGKLETLLGASVGVALKYVGFVPDDQNVRRATSLQRPLVTLAPSSPASRAFVRLAQTLLEVPVTVPHAIGLGVERTLEETFSPPPIRPRHAA